MCKKFVILAISHFITLFYNFTYYLISSRIKFLLSGRRNYKFKKYNALFYNKLLFNPNAQFSNNVLYSMICNVHSNLLTALHYTNIM